MSEHRAARSAPPRVAVAAWILLLASGMGLAQSDEGTVSRSDIDSPVVPVHEEPHHRQVFQYGPTRILDRQVPPGDISWFHTHEWPVLYMTLGTSAVRTQNLGSEWSGGGARAGNAQAGAAPRPAQPAPERRMPRATSTTSYIERPVTHRIENRGDGLFSAMVVVNETAGDNTTSVADAGFDLEPELTNAWFRSYRVTLAAGETTDAHAHATPVVIFQAIAGRAKANGPMDFEFNRPGQCVLRRRRRAHPSERRRRVDRAARDRSQGQIARTATSVFVMPPTGETPAH